jgi:hypothetical protein
MAITIQAREVQETEEAIWDRLLEPDKPTLTPAAARSILALEFPQADQKRMHDLAAKARAGTLTATEAEEIDVYGRVGSVLSILKSKARKSLRKASNGRS